MTQGWHSGVSPAWRTGGIGNPSHNIRKVAQYRVAQCSKATAASWHLAAGRLAHLVSVGAQASARQPMR